MRFHRQPSGLLLPEREFIAPGTCEWYLGNELHGFGGGGLIPPSVSFPAGAESTSALTTYTFSALALGAAAADRRIIVAAYGRSAGSRTVSTLTVAGISAALLVAANNTAGSCCELWIASVPTGTTGDVVVTFSSSMGRAAVGLLRLVDGKGGVTAFNSVSDIANPVTMLLDIPAVGLAIGAYLVGDTGATIAWTGLATEDLDSGWASGNGIRGLAHENALGVQPDRSISADSSGTDTEPAGVCCSFE